MTSRVASAPGIPWRVLQTGGWAALLWVLLQYADRVQTTLDRLVTGHAAHETRITVLEDRSGPRPLWMHSTDPDRPSK